MPSCIQIFGESNIICLACLGIGWFPPRSPRAAPDNLSFTRFIRWLPHNLIDAEVEIDHDGVAQHPLVLVSLLFRSGAPRANLTLPSEMDITSFIVGHRADALLIGDYNQYRALLTRRLLTLSKRLKRTTPKGKKYSKKPAITAEDIGTDTGYFF